MTPLNLTYLLQYLAEQVNQPACNLPRPAPAVLALFPVPQVRLLHVNELCPGTVDSQSAAQLAHRRIALLDPLPTTASRQSDNASRSHSTSHLCTSCPDSPCTVSTCRRVCPGAVVSSTSLQVPASCRPTAYSLSMGGRIYYHVAEYLVVDVAVQLFHQFRATLSRVHLQEHQGHFPFRREEGLASQLRPHTFPYQTEVLCHLAERKQLLYPAQFTLLKRRPIEVIKIELRKRNVWRYYRKISYF